MNQFHLTIQGFGGTPVIIDAAAPPSTVQRGGIFLVTADSVTLSNLQLQHAHTVSNTGAAVATSGTLDTLSNMTLTSNDVGAFVAGGTTTLTGVSATLNINGLEANAGAATATNSHFDSNTVNGAWVTKGGSLTTNTSAGPTTFSSNTVTGISNDLAASATINLTGTTADLNDIGIWIQGGGSLTTNNTVVNSNTDVNIAVQASHAAETIVLGSGSANAAGAGGATGVGVYLNSPQNTTIDANLFTANHNTLAGFEFLDNAGGTVNPGLTGLVGVSADANGSDGPDRQRRGSLTVKRRHVFLPDNRHRDAGHLAAGRTGVADKPHIGQKHRRPGV